MEATFDFAYIKSSFERLHGILADTSTDGSISNADAENLHGWLDRHKLLMKVEPFRSRSQLLYRYTENRFIDEDELKELIAWCREYTDMASSVFLPFEKATERLQRILQETHTDGSITDFGVVDLQGWLHDFGGFKTHWPLIEVRVLVEKILEQGAINEKEMGKLLDFYEGANWQVDNARKTDADLPAGPLFFQPIESLYTVGVDITFQGRRFCFTGDTKSGPRRKLINMARDLLGIVEHEVVPNLDYLVVGGIGNAFWPCSIYGKRIEQAIVNIGNDKSTAIIPEREFVSQATGMERKR
jgi:hypothetical protein